MKKNVAMLHSIGAQDIMTPYAKLSFPWEHFAEFCKYLSKKRVQTEFMDSWLHKKSRSLADNSFYLTFDDGFVDNWVYAYPIARKYGIKFTIFVNPEFVVDSDLKRDVLNPDAPVDGRHSVKGYLSWAEISEMQASGFVDIQSHSMSHTWYPIDFKVIDVLCKKNFHKYPWIVWNAYPQKKPYYLDSAFPAELDCYPVFSNGRSLGVRRHILPEKSLQSIQNYIMQQLSESESIDDCIRKINRYVFESRAYGRLETDEELYDRYTYELRESKVILEAKLNKPVDVLCWPGGAYNDLSVSLSRYVGYKASTLSSKGDANYMEWDDYHRIPRFGLSSFWYESHGENRFHCSIPKYIYHKGITGKRVMGGIVLSGIKKMCVKR